MEVNHPSPSLGDGIRSLSHFFRHREVWTAVVLQGVLSVFLAHGYDFRVEYMAGRNIVEGVSPYLGGALSGWMALGYGSQVQGIGETPLWAIYMGLCYFLSAGQPFLFNFLTKIPIVAANVSLAHFAYSNGARGWKFFLLNAYLIITTVTWGKPDNLATLLAVVALVATDSATGAAFLLSTSLMIKPLAAAILPAFFLRLRIKSIRWGVKFAGETMMVSAAMFLGPFVVLGWPLQTVINGFPNWFDHAGALSPFNFVKIVTGTEQIPSSIWWTGYLVLLGTSALIVYAILRKPQNTLRYALLSAAVFFTLRPWTSEQNLVVVLTLFILLMGELPSRWLWIIPMMFSLANNALQEQFYLLMPTIVDELNRLYAPFDIYRLWLKFFLSSVWLIVLWLNVASVQKQERNLKSYD
jgi:hypothetical protein